MTGIFLLTGQVLAGISHKDRGRQHSQSPSKFSKVWDSDLTCIAKNVTHPPIDDPAPKPQFGFSLLRKISQNFCRKCWISLKYFPVRKNHTCSRKNFLSETTFTKIYSNYQFKVVIIPDLRESVLSEKWTWTRSRWWFWTPPGAILSASSGNACRGYLDKWQESFCLQGRCWRG